MADSGEDTVIELDGIDKIYKTKGTLFGRSQKDVVALNQVSFRIQRGEIFGLVGESGSGKTTAGRLIVRLEDPSRGRILLDDEDIVAHKGKALKRFRRRVQMIFQDPYQSLNAQISVFDTIAEPLVIHKIGKGPERRAAVSQAVKSVGLSPPEEFLHRYPHQLSGGQRQRVAIARAMILNPEFVVADEPTSMLDASISAQIFNILLKIREDMNVTMLFITHNLAAARYLCDRIGVIYRGNLMELGPAESVIRDPRHPYTQALIDALPKFGDCGDIRHYGTLIKAHNEDADGHTGCAFFPRCKVSHRIRCSREVPPLAEVGESHLTACFYAEAADAAGPDADACYLGT
ncbi:MAG: ABC transporter ATP-binding protein [Deltaproteobacteria bacterium]|nr:ABC transporter ATP-binding protein [Deltaproteobacteria bacterium]MBW2284724.1 ABC transporter ATP-binding protein [Deltaproteobacteria bacterium]